VPLTAAEATSLPGHHHARRLNAPIVFVAVVCLFNLWYLRAERDPVADLNDGTFHAAYVRWAADPRPIGQPAAYP
jgi:hypothetical protein